MVSLKSPREKYDHYFGYYTFSASLGQLLGPIIAVVVAGSTGVLPKSIDTAFLAALLFSIVALAPVISWRGDGPTVKAMSTSGGALRSAGKLIRNPKIFAAIYTSLAISSVGDILIVFLPLFGTEKNFSSYSIGVIIAIRAGASMLSRLSLGALSNRFTTAQILVVSNSISVVACFAMAFASDVMTLGYFGIDRWLLSRSRAAVDNVPCHPGYSARRTGDRRLGPPDRKSIRPIYYSRRSWPARRILGHERSIYRALYPPCDYFLNSTPLNRSGYPHAMEPRR